jgi:hypothetical protein
MNAAATVSATTLVAAATLFAVFVALESANEDLGDTYYGTISDKTLGDVKFSRQGADRSLYYVDPETQNSILRANDYQITWNAEGELTECIGGREYAYRTDAMFPGGVGGDATVGVSPVGFVPLVDIEACYHLGMKQLQEENSSQRSKMAQYVRHLEEHDSSNMTGESLDSHNMSVSMANIAMLAYDDMQTNERSLHSFGMHVSDIMGFQIGSTDKGKSGSGYISQRYGVFKSATGHTYQSHAPLYFWKDTSQGFKYRCVFTIRGTDENKDWALDSMNHKQYLRSIYSRRTVGYFHRGFCTYTANLLGAYGRLVSNDYANAVVQTSSQSRTQGGNTWSYYADYCTTQLGADGIDGFYFVGHSLGAASAILMSAKFNQISDAYGFAAPEIHKYSYTTPYRTMTISGFRFFHEQDIVASNIPGYVRHNTHYASRRFTGRGHYSRVYHHQNRQNYMDIRKFYTDKSKFTSIFRWTCTSYYKNTVNSHLRGSEYCRRTGTGGRDSYEGKKSSNMTDSGFTAQPSEKQTHWIWPRGKDWGASQPMATQNNYYNIVTGYTNGTGKNVLVEDRDGDGNKDLQFAEYNVSANDHFNESSWTPNCWTAAAHFVNSSNNYGSIQGFNQNKFMQTLRKRNEDIHNKIVTVKDCYNTHRNSYNQNNNWCLTANGIGRQTLQNISLFVEDHPWTRLSNYGNFSVERRSDNHYRNSNYRDYCVFTKEPTVVFRQSVQDADLGIIWMSNYTSYASTGNTKCHNVHEVYALEMSMAHRTGFRLWSTQASARWSRNAMDDGRSHDI